MHKYQELAREIPHVQLSALGCKCNCSASTFPARKYTVDRIILHTDETERETRHVISHHGPINYAYKSVSRRLKFTFIICIAHTRGSNFIWQSRAAMPLKRYYNGGSHIRTCALCISIVEGTSRSFAMGFFLELGKIQCTKKEKEKAGENNARFAR